MSESQDTPIVNDAITSDDAGFSSDAGDQSFEEQAVEASEENVLEEAIEASSESEGIQAETKEELQEEIQDAIDEGATEEQIQDMIKEYTLKVNGKEKTVKLDLNNEQDIIRRLQLAEAGQSAMQKQKELEKTYEAELKRLMEKPWEVIEELGLDPVKLSEERLRAEVEERKKSPELRAKEQLERELAKAREELKKREDEARDAKMAKLEAEESAKLEAEIEAALDAHQNLPRSQKTVARIADAMLWAIENAEEMGLNPDDITVEDVMPSVEEDIRNELSEFMSQLPEEMMEEYIGRQNLERLRKKRLSAAKTNNISNVKPTTQSVETKEKKEPKKKLRSKDYFRNL